NAPPQPLNCPGGQFQVDLKCQPAQPSDLQGQSQSQSLFALPSWALNSFVMVGQSGVGWGGGDRGARMGLGGGGGSGAGGQEPPLPALGSAQAGQAPSSEAYSPFRPSSGAAVPGEVPALA